MNKQSQYQLAVQHVEMWLLVGIVCFLALLLLFRETLLGSRRFHVEVEKPKIIVKGFNILPLIKLVVGLLPHSLKTSNLIKEVRLILKKSPKKS